MRIGRRERCRSKSGFSLPRHQWRSRRCVTPRTGHEGDSNITPQGHVPERTGHAVLFATSVPLFFGALLSDWAYSSTYVIQWTNFASWLNAGALIIAGAALLWSLIGLMRGRAVKRDGRAWLYVGLVAAVLVVGFINALVHAKDAWAAMPTALILSVIVFLLALVAAWIGLSTGKREVAR